MQATVVIKLANGHIVGPETALYEEDFTQFNYCRDLATVAAFLASGVSSMPEQQEQSRQEAPLPAAALPVAAAAPGAAPKKRPGRKKKVSPLAPVNEPAKPEVAASNSGSGSPISAPVAATPREGVSPWDDSAASAPVQAQPEPAADAVTVAQVRDAMNALLAKHGLPLVREVLAKLSATCISELKPEYYADMVDACRKAMLSGKV